MKELDLYSLPTTRAEAVASKSTYYYTGKPCKHGHKSPRSVGGGCVECRRRQNTSTERYLYLQTYYKNHPMKKVLNGIRARAKQNGIEFTLELEHIINIPDKCPVLGIELKHHQGRMSDNSPSIDRIDPTKGYTPDNIEIISWRANKIKSDATPEELQMLAEFYNK